MSGPHGPNESTTVGHPTVVPPRVRARRRPPSSSPPTRTPPTSTVRQLPGAEQGQWQQSQAWGQPHQGAPNPGPAQQWGPAPQGWPQQNPGQQQWGAPGQPQWGPGNQGMAQGYPQQFGQPGNQWAPPQQGPRQGGGKTMLWVGIGVAAVVVVALVGWLLTSALGGKTLDEQAAQRGVEQIVTESYGARSVTGVSCPSGQKVEKGASFECSLTVDGSPKSVKVTFTDGEGTYEVSRPS
ncbi:DUF4333 domain-containing protein [Rhodococcus hoagii]|nr:DUF4333 domain-containing protein [Prescottella equi]